MVHHLTGCHLSLEIEKVTRDISRFPFPKHREHMQCCSLPVGVMEVKSPNCHVLDSGTLLFSEAHWI